MVGGSLRKRAGALAGPGAADLRAPVEQLPLPAPHAWTGPYDLLVTGVGGTGVVTVGAVIAMAAHLEGKAASVLDFMGFAQKGGSVLSFVRLRQGPGGAEPGAHRRAAGRRGARPATSSSPRRAEALQTVRHGRTRVLANMHEMPVAESLSIRTPACKVDALLQKIEFAAGNERVETLDAQALAEEFLGDTIVSNILAMGYAWQRGLVPVGLAALQRAIELNGVAVESNQAAFSLGRLAAADPEACRELLHEPRPGVAPRRDGRRAGRARGALPRRLPGRGLCRALSPAGRHGAGAARRRQRRRRRPAAHARGGHAAAAS